MSTPESTDDVGADATARVVTAPLPEQRRIPTEHLYAPDPRTPGGELATVALQSLNRRLKEADEQALRQLATGPLDARALLHVTQQHRHGGATRPSDLVGVLRVTSAAVTKLVDRLERAGHIERRPNPLDRRGVILVPTGDVAETLERVYGRIHGPVVGVVDEFSEADLDVVTRFAARLAEAFREATHGDGAPVTPIPGTASIPMSTPAAPAGPPAAAPPHSS